MPNLKFKEDIYMRINNNMMAMNTTRQLGINSSNSTKSMEKLSSGYRINKAGDDAAGLAISEKMRSQIRGLNQASKNAQEGISLIQTAEGGLNETHAILQRMRELAVQASTGTLQDADRGQIDKEFQQLRLEANEIAENTQFNKMTLLDGNFGARVSGGTAVIETFDPETGAHAAGITGLRGIQLNGTAAETYTITDDGTDLTVADAAGNEAVIITGTMDDGAQTLNIEQFGINISTDKNFVAASLNGLTIVVSGSSVDVQTGANSNEVLSVSIANMTTTASGLNLDTSNVSSASSAVTAISNLETAIKTVSDERAKLGATQNRLEYKIKNLDSSSENLQAAESKIRDVDMAKEMVEYTKNDILQQAAQAMLAKANQAPQAVLQLLR
jgi:flagellin